MERKNTQYVVAIVALVIAVVGMSIGFAFSDVNLTVNGNVTTKSTAWDIHFKEAKNVTGVTATNAIKIGTDTTTASYTVTLSKPGDYYEFELVVENGGDFDAQLATITLTPTTSIAYLTHSVTYNGSTYTSASNTITSAPTLAAGGTETIKVRISYDEPANDSDLPSSDVTNTYNVTLTYKQVTSS